jgi:hypothetical protein
MKKIIIKPERYPENPRSNDNLCTMVCFHNRYDLGDSHHTYTQNNYSSWKELSEAILKDHDVCAILPLYLYDHSGITMSTGEFHCKWDSGQVGFIYITTKEAIETWGEGSDYVKKAEVCLQHEVEEYDKYLTGDVYQYEIIEQVEMVSMTKQDWEAGNCDDVEHFTKNVVMDSCCGFYGNDWFNNGMSEHIPEELHEQLKTIEITYE